MIQTIIDDAKTMESEGILLCADDLRLHSLGIIDDGLDHAHHSTVVLLVLLEPCRRGLALLDKCVLLVVEALENVKGGSEQLLCGALVRDDKLELLVLLLAILTTTLHVEVELCDLLLKSINLRCQSLDLQLQILDQSEEVLLLGLLTLGLQLVGVELINAPVLVLDLVNLLSHELGDHVINCLLDTHKGIKLHFHGNGSKTRATDPQCDLFQQLGCGGLALAVLRHLDQSRVESLGEQIMCLIGTQHCQCLRACLHLELASLGALFPLGISAGALLLEHGQERLVLSKCLLGVLKIFTVLCELLLSISILLSLGINLVLAS